MKKYLCEPCGYEYDPAEGDPSQGIEPGTAFEDLPEDWVFSIVFIITGVENVPQIFVGRFSVQKLSSAFQAPIVLLKKCDIIDSNIHSMNVGRKEHGKKRAEDQCDEDFGERKNQV